MNTTFESIEKKLLKAFEQEFGFLKDKFEIINLLVDNSPMDPEIIDCLKLPTAENNIVWHPGVYVFIGNNSIYRVGVSMNNSRGRVLQHLEACTEKNGHCIWDINEFDDKSILLFNVKDKSDTHWLLALEAFFETRFQPLISACRIG